MPASMGEASSAIRSSTPAREVENDVTEHRQTVNAPGAPAAIGPYNHAVRTGNLLFCSGQIPLDPDTGEIVGSTPAEFGVFFRAERDQWAKVVRETGARIE